MKKWFIGSALFGILGAILAFTRPEPVPRPELRVAGTMMIQGVDCYELELINHTPHDLQFPGVLPEEPELEYLYWEHGKWKEPQGYRCRFGIGPQILKSGSSVRFTTPRPLDTRCRFGVLLCAPDYVASRLYEFDWLPEGLRTWVRNWQEQRQHEQWLENITWTPPLDPAPYTPAERLVMEALEDGVTMDLENLFEEDPYAAGPPAPFCPDQVGTAWFGPTPAGADPFAPVPVGSAPGPPLGADPFTPAPASASISR